ncbi:hypothetical protein V8E52_011003, partial [Russula decolorans]
HSRISERLLTAAAEITQADHVGISTPIPSEEATTNGNVPTSFLIYNLSNDEISTLSQQGVWSSPAITFRVAKLHPPRPDFLFTIKGFKTRDDASILSMVQTIWQGNDIQNLISDITDSFDDDSCSKVRNNILVFLNSVYIKRLKFRTKGNVEVPRFNIYANGELV